MTLLINEIHTIDSLQTGYIEPVHLRDTKTAKLPKAHDINLRFVTVTHDEATATVQSSERVARAHSRSPLSPAANQGRPPAA